MIINSGLFIELMLRLICSHYKRLVCQKPQLPKLTTKKGTQFLKTHGLKKNQVNNLMHIH